MEERLVLPPAPAPAPQAVVEGLSPCVRGEGHLDVRVKGRLLDEPRLDV